MRSRWQRCSPRRRPPRPTAEQLLVDDGWQPVVAPAPAAVAVQVNRVNGTGQDPNGQGAAPVNGQGRDDEAPAPQQEERFSWAEFLAQVPAQPKRRGKQPPASLPLFEWLVAQEQEAELVSVGR